eukprot:g3661.t1
MTDIGGYWDYNFINSAKEKNFGLHLQRCFVFLLLCKNKVCILEFTPEKNDITGPRSLKGIYHQILAISGALYQSAH